MKVVKKRGRKLTSSFLLSGDRIVDETRFRGILLVNNKTYDDVAKDLNITTSAVCKYIKIRARSRRFFRYIEVLARKNNINVQRAECL